MVMCSVVTEVNNCSYEPNILYLICHPVVSCLQLLLVLKSLLKKILECEFFIGDLIIGVVFLIFVILYS